MILNELLLKESDLQTGKVNPYDFFVSLRDEIKSSKVGQLPGGEGLINKIDEYAKQLEDANIEGDNEKMNDILMKVFEFNGEFIDLQNATREYDYSPGNVVLLKIQKAPDTVMGTADWWRKEHHMVPKPNAKFKIVLKPILGKANDFTEVQTIKDSLTATYPFSSIRGKIKKEILDKNPTIDQDGQYTGQQIFNMAQRKPLDFDVISTLTDRQTRNYVAQFLLMALGLKPRMRDQGWQMGHLLSRDQLVPETTGAKTNKKVTPEDVDTAIAISEEVSDALLEIDQYESEIRDMTDETGLALFNDVILQIKNITEQPENNAEANMAFLMSLLDLQDRINRLRSNKTTYGYSTRNLLYLAMQSDDLTEVGPRTYWFIQNKRPKADAAGKIILKPITEEDPMELVSVVKDRVVVPKMIKSNMMLNYFKNAGVDFMDGEYTTEQLYKIYYNLPESHDLESEAGWDFKLARFYIELTGLKRHRTKGYNISVVYDVSDVEQIPDTEVVDRLVIPQVFDIRYDGDTEKLKAILIAVTQILSEMRNNFGVSKAAREAIANKCLYPQTFDPNYKEPLSLVGKDKSAMNQFDLMRTQKGDSPIINQIARTIHLLVHEMSHFNRGALSKNYTGDSKNQADQIYYDYFGLQPGVRLYHNPVDTKYTGSEMQRQKSIGRNPQYSGSFAGLTTGYGEENRYIRETQAELITAMVMKSLAIPTQMVGNNIRLLSAVSGEKDTDNTMGNEVQYYIDVANTILKKIHEKLDTLQEQHRSLKSLAEQILIIKDLLK